MCLNKPVKIRQILEEKEENTLSRYAQKSRLTRGRLKEEEECDIRPCFQHDRDRIIHSKAFRRLKHKTQVFLAPQGDHYRTRLTHTLEVAQIARTIAKALALNEDLVEAISLGHDLGHTPFGHAGEEVLNAIYPSGFRHNEQSLRVVDVLERDGSGLNLTMEVRDGILRHSKGRGEIVVRDGEERPLTREAEVVRVSDIIAYLSHDIDDAIRGQVISPKDIPDDCVRFFGPTHSKRIDTMVRGVIFESLRDGELSISISEELEYYMKKLRDFLYERVYEAPLVHDVFLKCYKIIEDLYTYFLKNPARFLEEAGLEDFYDERERCIVDFIAGMTDRYAFKLYEKIFLPLPWRIPF